MNHNNWRNACLAKAMKRNHTISHHRDSCGDGGSGCICDPDQGSFDGYTPAGVFEILRWLNVQPWQEEFFCYVTQKNRPPLCW